MALVAQNEARWWLVKGYTLAPQDPGVRGREYVSATSLRVWAPTAGIAEALFAEEYRADVRVESVAVTP